MSQPTSGSPAAPPQVQLATFLLGAQEYALDIMRIKEIINPLPITKVPGAPGFMEGVIELRGVILPVVDLRKRFDLPAPAPTRASKYVLVTVEDRIVALVVDGVSEFLRKGPAEIKPTPSLALFGADKSAAAATAAAGTAGAAAAASGFFVGVCHHHGRIVMILDIDRVLSSQERVSLRQLSGEA